MTAGTVRGAVMAGLLSLGSTPADAHTLDDRYGPFLGSFLHPLTSMDHGLAFVALGLLGGQQARHWWRTVVSFLSGAAVGTSIPWLIGLGGSAATLTTVNAASLVVLGGLVALGRPLPAPLSMVVAAVFGLSHGIENGMDMAPESRSLASVVGVLAAALFTGTPFAIAVAALRAAWLRTGVQVLGSWVAAIGLIMLGFRLR
jgi:urease accessory protein